MLFLYGEAELAQTNPIVARSALRFISELTVLVRIRLFGFEEGWAASHRHTGALAALQDTVFDWLDIDFKSLHDPHKCDVGTSLDVFMKYIAHGPRRKEAEDIVARIRT